MISETVTIVIPIPNKVLSPNYITASMRGRFMKASAAKKLRKETKEAVVSHCIEDCPWKKAAVKPVFYHKEFRIRDDDNYVGMLKAAYDGIVDAGLLLDDNSQVMEREKPVFKIDKLHPRVELIVSRLE